MGSLQLQYYIRTPDLPWTAYDKRLTGTRIFAGIVAGFSQSPTFTRCSVRMPDEVIASISRPATPIVSHPDGKQISGEKYDISQAEFKFLVVAVVTRPGGVHPEEESAAQSTGHWRLGTPPIPPANMLLVQVRADVKVEVIGPTLVNVHPPLDRNTLHGKKGIFNDVKKKVPRAKSEQAHHV